MKKYLFLLLSTIIFSCGTMSDSYYDSKTLKLKPSPSFIRVLPVGTNTFFLNQSTPLHTQIVLGSTEGKSGKIITPTSFMDGQLIDSISIEVGDIFLPVKIQQIRIEKVENPQAINGMYYLNKINFTLETEVVKSMTTIPRKVAINLFTEDNTPLRFAFLNNNVNQFLAYCIYQ